MKRVKIDNNKITGEVQRINKLISYTTEPYPLNALSDREFEILLYLIFKEDIRNGEYSNVYDNVDLMQGVGEQGRDIVLIKNGTDKGIIQCKKVNKNLDKPTVVKEIIKLLLFNFINKEIIPDPKDFIYYLAVSTGLAGTTKKLLRNFSDIKNEPIEKWTKDVINNFKSFGSLTYSEIEPNLLFALQNIKVEQILPQDIHFSLNNNVKVAQNFFKIQTVTDNKLLDKVVKKYLVPILNALPNEENLNKKAYSFRFTQYLERAFEHYSYAKTMVFGNQQKKLEDFYYPLTVENKSKSLKIQNYSNLFIPKYRKILINDTGGMGKSTIMKWLFLSIIRQKKGIPILIELRKLKNNHKIIDEIIKQIEPIDEKLEKRVTQKLIAQGGFVFLLDGYDEISLNHRSYVTSDIQDFITKANNNFFVLTSRPESALSSFSDFLEFKIKPLEKTEAFELISKLGNDDNRSRRLIQKIEERQIDNIDEFLESPLLVSLLYKKFEYRETIPFDKPDFYRGVFEALFEGHDLTKGDSYERDKKSNLTQSQFHSVLRTLGFITMKEFEVEYTRVQIEKYLIEAFKQSPNIDCDVLNFLKDLIVAVPLFHKEGGNYKWAHKSLQEYFAAEFICRHPQQKDILRAIVNTKKVDFNLDEEEENEKTEKLTNVLDLCSYIDFKTFRNVVLYDLCLKFTLFCSNSYREITKKNTIPLEEVRRRQEFTFVRDCYLIKMNKEQISKINSADDIDAHLEVISEIASEYMPKLGLSSMSFMPSPDRYIAGYKSKLNYLYSKQTRKHLEKKNKPRKKFNADYNILKDCPTEKVIEINDNPVSIVNSEYSFAKVTNFINDTWVLDYDKCKQLVIDVEKDENNNVNSNWLLNGL